jgi:hypothetical protein
MSRRPLLIAAAIAALAFAARAAASPVLVYDDGQVTKADDPWLPAATTANPLVGTPHQCISGDAPVANAAAVSVGKALQRAYAKGAIDRQTYSAYGGVYSKAKSAWHKLGEFAPTRTFRSHVKDDRRSRR